MTDPSAGAAIAPETLRHCKIICPPKPWLAVGLGAKVVFGSPSVSIDMIVDPAAAATSTAADPPMVALAVAINDTPIAGAIPFGRPTAWN